MRYIIQFCFGKSCIPYVNAKGETVNFVLDCNRDEQLNTCMLNSPLMIVNAFLQQHPNRNDGLQLLSMTRCFDQGPMDNTSWDLHAFAVTLSLYLDREQEASRLIIEKKYEEAQVYIGWMEQMHFGAVHLFNKTNELKTLMRFEKFADKRKLAKKT